MGGAQWTETAVLEAAPIATGIQTGGVVAHSSSGTYWLRSAVSTDPPAGPVLDRLDPGMSAPMPTAVDLSDVEWFTWLE